jgi:hypothetical protein
MTRGIQGPIGEDFAHRTQESLGGVRAGRGSGLGLRAAGTREVPVKRGLGGHWLLGGLIV